MTDRSSLARGIARSITRGITPRITGLCGLAAVVCLLVGVALAYAAYPGYAISLRYISELAHPRNPGRHFFTLALVTAGPLIACFALGLRNLVPNRPGRLASGLLVATGLSMPVVAAFDLHSPLPHFTAAAVLFGSAVLGTLFAGLAFRRLGGDSTQEASRAPRLAARIAFAVFGLQVTSTLAGFLYTAFLVARMNVGSADQLLRDLPSHQTIRLGASGPLVNPVALMEWVFLGTAMGLILLASLFALTRTRTPEAEAPRG